MDESKTTETVCIVETMYFSVERRCLVTKVGDRTYTAIFDKSGEYIVEVVVVTANKKDNPFKQRYSWRRQ